MNTCCVLSCTLLCLESELERIKKMNKTPFSQLDKLTNIVKAKESESINKSKGKNYSYF